MQGLKESRHLDAAGHVAHLLVPLLEQLRPAHNDAGDARAYHNVAITRLRHARICRQACFPRHGSAALLNRYGCWQKGSGWTQPIQLLHQCYCGGHSLARVHKGCCSAQCVHAGGWHGWARTLLVWHSSRTDKCVHHAGMPQFARARQCTVSSRIDQGPDQAPAAGHTMHAHRARAGWSRARARCA